MKRVYLVTSPLINGHAVRGVGFYTKRLLAHLELQGSHFNIELVDNPNKADLIHYPFFDLFDQSLPILKLKKTVVTVHDVIPLEFSSHYPLGISSQINLHLQKLALSQVDRVITDSYASVQGIHKYLGVSHEKIKLVYLAADEIFKPIEQKSVLEKVKQKYQLPDKFVLYVGDVGWNKNLSGLIKAAGIVGWPLVLVGKNALEIDKLDLSHPELQHLQGLFTDKILRLGYVSDIDLVSIYNLAYVYCQPSFAEGFGLPVLEALACDCPVACSNSHSLPEIGGSAVAYFDPHKTEDIVVALKKAKARNNLMQAAKFSWEKTASETIMVYQEVFG